MKEWDVMMEVFKSKYIPEDKLFSFYNEVGQNIYKLARDINLEIVSLHDYVLFNVFSDIDFYKLVDNSPMWVRDAGHSEESCLTKKQFEKLVKLNNNILTNKFLYYHDLEALVNSVQNRFSMITKMIDLLYFKLSPVLDLKISEYDNVGFSSDIETHALLNTAIINVCSCCDILTKLTYELSNISDITYENYPKLKSKDILYSSIKHLPSDLKQDNTLFSKKRPKVIAMFDSLRNEIIHNGSLDFNYSVYYGNKNKNIYSWIFFPEFEESGILSSYNARRKFYPDTQKTFNTELPLMCVEFLSIALETIKTLNSKFACQYFSSDNELERFKVEVLNWYISYVSVYSPKNDRKNDDD